MSEFSYPVRRRSGEGDAVLASESGSRCFHERHVVLLVCGVSTAFCSDGVLPVHVYTVESIDLHDSESVGEEGASVLSTCDEVGEDMRRRRIVERPTTDGEPYLESRVTLLQCRGLEPKIGVARGHLHDRKSRRDESESKVDCERSQFESSNDSVRMYRASEPRRQSAREDRCRMLDRWMPMLRNSRCVDARFLLLRQRSQKVERGYSWID
jgi:hypothetical protein